LYLLLELLPLAVLLQALLNMSERFTRQSLFREALNVAIVDLLAKEGVYAIN
jgi:hypothetical protein